MFKSKSFNLYNEETSKQTKQLYQPRRMRWLKFILLPVATCFVIFLVVYNIDFSSESFQTNSTSVSNYFDYAGIIYFDGLESTKSKMLTNQNKLVRCYAFFINCKQLYPENYESSHEKIPDNENIDQRLVIKLSFLDTCFLIESVGMGDNMEEIIKVNCFLNISMPNGTFDKESKLFNISTEYLELIQIKNLTAKIVINLSDLHSHPFEIYIKITLFDKERQCALNNMELLQRNLNTTSIGKLRKSRSTVNLYGTTVLETIDPNYSTTPLTTTTTPKQTARTKTSTKTTPSISVSDSTHSTTMICVSPTKELISNKSVSYNGNIQIVDSSSKSVKVVLSQVDLEFWKLVYFSNYSQLNYVKINETDKTLYDTTIELDFLNCNTAFVFCLLSDENTTSPFNCQSHQTMTCDATNSWFIEQSSLIIGITIAGILCSVILGSVAMYCTLRFRPTWLHGSKRLVRLVRDSQTMYLLPKNFKNELYGSSKNQVLDVAASEYVEYFRHLEQGNLYKSGSNNYNIPPQESAPSVPIPHYTYESFELYEELEWGCSCSPNKIAWQSCRNNFIGMQSDENQNQNQRPEDRTAQRPKKKNLSDANDSSTKILAWILLGLGIGLFIIASIICILLWLNGRENNNTVDNNADIATNNDTSEHIVDGDFNFSFEQLGKLINSDIVMTTPSKQGCYEKSCQVKCFNSDDIFKDTAEVMNFTSCVSITCLEISEQNINYFEDKWIEVNSTVLKIVLRKSQFVKIKSGAFASPMFAKVFHMSWIDLELNELSNGALLGLYSLRILEISGNIPKIGLSFLQPVQLTLTHLKLNSGLTFQSDDNIFDNINLNKLNHLDLSFNKFSGTLSKSIFHGTPNVSYLYLRSCQITSIADNAFEDIANKLVLVDLKQNLLTQINDNVFRIGLLIDLEPNNWNCDCELQSLVQFYNDNKSGFLSTPYCRAPYYLYGKGFDELNALELSCDQTTRFPYNASKTMETIKPETDNKEDELLSTARNTNAYEDVIDENVFGAILQFSCSEAIDINSDESTRIKRDLNNQKSSTENTAYNSGTFVFEPPIYDLDLDIFENFSIRALIDGYNTNEQLNILWFTDNDESDISGINLSQTDYNCMQYEEPYLIIDPLKQNHTYTFCMMPINDLVISPLYCQPLYIPIAKSANNTDDIWISESEKQFTIAMLCLIFFISTIFGAIFAYLGIKSFPHLLEGSKNVLVIKESEKITSISTIADPIALKNSLKHQLSNNTVNDESKMTTKATDELSKCPSSSTCFEESFSSIDFQAIEYEMPMQFVKNIKEGCNVVQCVDKPKSPPPLPKRNSNISLIPDR